MNKTKLFGSMALGLVAGAGVGGLSVAAYLFVSIGDTITETPIIETAQTEGDQIEIIEHTVNGKFLLGESGRLKLMKRMEEDLGIGPEFHSLNAIVLAGEPAISSGSWGYYVPGAQIIVLNIDLFHQRISGSQYDDELVELVMQTLHHEYEHHVAASYVNSVPLTHSSSSNDIWASWENEVYQQNWLEYYVDEFKSALNYDVSTPKYSSETLGSNIKSIGSLYDAKDLFDGSNDVTQKGYDIESSLSPVESYGFSGTNIWDVAGNYILDYNTNEEFNDRAIYTYSMDELFARKNMQLKYKYNPDALHEHWDRGQEWGFYNSLGTLGIETSMYINGTGMWEDRTSYETSGDSWATTNQYLADNPFEGDAEDKLNAVYNKVIGSDIGADLSYLWFENDVDLNYDVSNLNYVYSNNAISKVENIKFGGYISDAAYEYISFQDSQGSWTHIPIDIWEYKNGYKATVDATVWQDTQVDSHYYVLRDFVDSSLIEGKQLFFSKGIDQNNDPHLPTALNGTRNSYESGNAADFRGQGPLLDHKDNFFTGAENHSGHITIEKWDLNG